MDLFIALDVSLASTALCALNAHGKLVKEAKVDSAPEALVAATPAPAPASSAGRKATAVAIPSASERFSALGALPTTARMTPNPVPAMPRPTRISRN